MMRTFVRFALLAATVATPLAAQDGPGDRGPRPDRGQEEIRAGRGDNRNDVRQAGPLDRMRDREVIRAGRDDGPRPPRPDWRGDRDDRGPDRPRPGFDGPRPGPAAGPDRRWEGGRGWNGDRGGPDRRWDNDRRRDDRRWDNAGRRDDRRWNDDRRWDSSWRGDRRYDWQGYRSANRGLYRLPRYAAPRGYAGYSRWVPGRRIQPYFYGQSYWISDPYRYRLPPAYGGYRWVRYYDDVALVDVRSGLIADVIYSFFY